MNTSEFSACVQVRPWDAPPPLVYEYADGELTLSWEVGTAHALYCTTNLVEPIQWTLATNEVSTVEGAHQVVVTPVDGSKFFALLEP